MSTQKPRLDRLGRQFGLNLPFSPADRALIFDAVPEKEREELWASLRQQREDERFADGLTKFRARPKPNPPRPRATNKAQLEDGWQRGNDLLNSIGAETYLQVLAEAEPSRGRCRCPLPDHEDRNPSASYKDNVWFCHRCGVGGSIFTLGAAITGLRERGEDFLALRKWLAQQLLRGLS